MPALTIPGHSESINQITMYLSTGPEPIKDPLAWWYEKRTAYPTLSQMALDYLSIPGKCWPLFTA